MKTPIPLPTSLASPPSSVSSSTRSISMSPESARPLTAGTSMPGLHCSRSLALTPASRWAKDLITPRTCVDVVGLRVAELPDRLVQGAGERSAQPLVGPGLELAGPPPPADRRGAQRVEQHGLADPAQAGQHQAALGTPLGDPLQDDVEGLELLVASGELGRSLPGAGGVRVPDGVHAYDRIGVSSGSRRFPSRGVEEARAALSRLLRRRAPPPDRCGGGSAG